MPELETRHPKEDLRPFAGLLERVASIDGLPPGAIRPLAALIRSSGHETQSYLSRLRSSLRHGLGELVPILEQRGEASGDECKCAKAFLGSIDDGSAAPPKRSWFKADAIAILKSCDCSMKEAAAHTSALYPIVGWKQPYPDSIKSSFYKEAPKTLRGDRNEHHDRIRKEYERIANRLELYGASQLDSH